MQYVIDGWMHWTVYLLICDLDVFEMCVLIIAGVFDLRYVVSLCLSEIGTSACLYPIVFSVQEEVELQ